MYCISAKVSEFTYPLRYLYNTIPVGEEILLYAIVLHIIRKPFVMFESHWLKRSLVRIMIVEDMFLPTLGTYNVLTVYSVLYCTYVSELSCSFQICPFSICSKLFVLLLKERHKSLNFFPYSKIAHC